jgi:hypothetical protein
MQDEGLAILSWGLHAPPCWAELTFVGLAIISFVGLAFVQSIDTELLQLVLLKLRHRLSYAAAYEAVGGKVWRFRKYISKCDPKLTVPGLAAGEGARWSSSPY